MRAWIALAVLAAAALPPARAALEGSMTLHMLVQFPLVAACGWVLAGRWPARWAPALQRYDAHGISGLLFVALVLGLLMVPRLLDLALVDPRVAAAKWLALLACGAALRASWRRAGAIVQGFFLGNVLPMTAVAGQLYQDSPLRLCNAYLLEDQAWLGGALVAGAVAVGFAWITALFLRLARRGEGSLPAEA